MKRVSLILLTTLALCIPLAAQRGTSTAAAKPVQVYVVDTEGGKAALWVSPTGQSLLIDSGNPGNRDVDRIIAAISDAGVKQIDFLISTHYHVDHIGGMQELAKRIPIAHYIDHGPTVEQPEQVQGFQAAYAELYSKAKHTVVKAGDKVPITGLDWRIVSAAGGVLKTPLPGAGKPNAACAGVPPKEASATDENAMSVGSLVTYGQFRAIDLGDLIWAKEYELMCPNNPIGTIDAFFVTHHGLDQSNSPALIHGVQPRVAIMQNGTRKGAGAETMPTMRTSPGLEDIWQLHWSYTAGIEQNSAGVFIANVDDNATIASVLTAPARGGFSGGVRGGAPNGAPGAAVVPGGGSTAPSTGTPPPGTAPAVVGTPPAAAPAPGAPPSAAAQAPPVGAGAPAGPGAPSGAAGGRGGQGAAAHTPAYWIKLTALPDGTITVTNNRNGFTKTYKKAR